MSDPFGRALREFARGEMDAPLVQRDGEETIEHPVGDIYFSPFDLDSPEGKWLASWLDGPLLDLGAGVGRHALTFQKRHETVAVEVSDTLVETMTDRGVDDARIGDLFAIESQFDAGRFSSVLLNGTQASLVGSRAGLGDLLESLDTITTGDGTVVLDSYDPTASDVTELLGYRPDPTPELAFRVFHFEYDGDVGETLLFRLFSPDVVAAVASESGWHLVESVRPFDSECYYRAVLQNSET